MSQSDFGTINPDTKGGIELASDLNNWRDALHSMHSGSKAPTYVATGMTWLDTTAALNIVKIYDGSAWLDLFRVDTTNDAIEWPSQIINGTGTGTKVIDVQSSGSTIFEVLGNGDVNSYGAININTGVINTALNLRSTDITTNLSMADSTGSVVLRNTSSGEFAFLTGGASDGTGSSEQMRLTTSGWLGVGTSSPASPLNVTKTADSTYITTLNNNGNTSAHVLKLSTSAGGPASYVIDAQGGGTTIFQVAANGASSFTGNTSENPVLELTQNGSSAEGLKINGGTLEVNGAPLNIYRDDAVSVNIFRNNDGNIIHGYIGGTIEGRITNTAASGMAFNNPSDRDLKENITTAPDTGALFDALEVVSHDWIGRDTPTVRWGMIAQDVHAVFPEAVFVGEGAEHDDPWGISDAAFIKPLVHEVKSLRGRVADLEARLAALEAGA